MERRVLLLAFLLGVVRKKHNAYNSSIIAITDFGNINRKNLHKS